MMYHHQFYSHNVSGVQGRENIAMMVCNLETVYGRQYLGVRCHINSKWNMLSKIGLQCFVKHSNYKAL